MLREIVSKETGVFAIALVGIFVLALLPNRGAVGSQQQANPNDKVIERLFFEEVSPVAIDLTLAGKSLKFGDKFSDDEDWLSHVCIRLKNLYPKPLVFARLYLDFPQTEATGNVMAFPISFGRNPRDRFRSGEQKRLQSEDSAELRLSKDEYSGLKRFLERRHSMASITHARLRLEEVQFEDSSIWSDGWMRQDPNNPNRLIPIKDQ